MRMFCLFQFQPFFSKSCKITTSTEFYTPNIELLPRLGTAHTTSDLSWRASFKVCTSWSVTNSGTGRAAMHARWCGGSSSTLSCCRSSWTSPTPPSSVQSTRSSAPHYVVIAFRSTIIKKGLTSMDLQLIRNGLEHTTCFRTAMQTIHNTVAVVGHDCVWLAAYSLGSTISNSA